MDLSALTIQQLRYIVAVDQHRSFREAARGCHVSQPALSTQIKKVEDMLECMLFDRTRQPVTPTERGRLVIDHARAILEQIDHFAEIAGGTDEVAGGYRLGILPTLATTILPRLLPRFVRAYPGVALEVFETQTDLLVRRLRDGTLDGGIAVTPLDVPGIQERVVCHEAFLVYLPPRHPLAEKDRLKQASLTDEHVWLLSEGHCFRSQTLHLCSVDRRWLAGDSPNVLFDGGSFDTLMGLVDAGLGITIVPELLAATLPAGRRAAQVRRFSEPEPKREISLLVAREHLRRGIADALLATLLEALPAELQRRPRPRNVLTPRV
ncbi:MAG: hydrogen peroxide-inducible genes activator [Labilithrix sp.]|nr:hydrogen peroxide-inducible genes activator [Labilithrix sp.]MCW5816761.1 hydrogen peroxide-inducible genes activator [Labilithrix sp.]